MHCDLLGLLYSPPLRPHLDSEVHRVRDLRRKTTQGIYRINDNLNLNIFLRYYFLVGLYKAHHI